MVKIWASTLSFFIAFSISSGCRPFGRDSSSPALERAEPGDASFTFPREQTIERGAPSLARAWVRKRAPLFKQAALAPSNKVWRPLATRAPLMHLSRAEEVALLSRDRDESRVRAADGQEGYIETALLAEGPEVRLATLLGTSPYFARPDLLAPKLGDARTAALFLILKTHEGFAQVEGGAGVSGWMLSSLLSSDSNEVLAAKLLNQAESPEIGLAELTQAKLTHTALFQQLIAKQVAPTTVPANPGYRSVPGGESVPWGPELAPPELGLERPPAPSGAGETETERAVVDPDAWESLPPHDEDPLAPAPAPAAPVPAPAPIPPYPAGLSDPKGVPSERR